MADIAPVTMAKRRVLVVEDEYFIADDLVRALERRGAEVVGPASTLQQALELLSSTAEISGAVLDVNLRGERVFPLADELMRRGVPFVFATGYDQGSLPDAYRQVPCWAKPYNDEGLVQALPALFR
jgi:CheY-like chemotaxis protein